MCLCVFKVLTWDVGKITPQKLPNLKGIVNLQSGAPKPEENPSLNIQFKIQQLAISGKTIALNRNMGSYVELEHLQI